MSHQQRIRTAESVSPRHPDKLCDQISDAILDEILSQDPHARVAIEAVGGHGLLTVTGEVTTKATVDYEQIADGFVSDDTDITINVVQQSPEIAAGVDSGGAGDQGIMVGYATDETDNLMPLEVDLSRSLNQYIYKHVPYDGKTQITVKGKTITAIVASFQNTSHKELKEHIVDWLQGKPVDHNVVIHANPAGDWHIGGFESDVGLTGRKLAVDNYGPRIPIGGGCFSGKDPSKVDRSAAYMARRIAVDYLKERRAKEVYCELAYAIGVAEPVQATVIIDEREEPVKGYDLTPSGIIAALDLIKPQYTETAKWGHFGNGFTWDQG